MLGRIGLATALTAIVLLVLAAPAGAKTYHVTQKSDHAGACDEHCALREALMAANLTPSDDTVKVPKGTYTLSIGSKDTFAGCAGDADFGDLDVCSGGGALTLVGAGAKRTVIDADQIDGVLETHGGKGSGPFVRISGVTLTGGVPRFSLSLEGGGLAVDGNDTTVVRSVIRGNRTLAFSPGNGPDGGGISNTGFLTLKRDTIRGNSTAGGGDGGGITNENALTIRASTISGNVAHSEAGNDGDGGGLNNSGTATIVNSTFSGNRGGTADSSDGGAIYTDGDLSLLNTTIAFNKSQFGGGIAAVSDVLNTQTIENSLLARNAVFAGGTENCGGFLGLTSLGHNLEQGGTCGFTGPGDIHGKARLAPLADNGGPTKTHVLRRHSKAINRGRNSSCPPTDQRGVHRPQGPRCDIGSFERKRRHRHHNH